jgi:hypothetical protein
MFFFLAKSTLAANKKNARMQEFSFYLMIEKEKKLYLMKVTENVDFRI